MIWKICHIQKIVSYSWSRKKCQKTLRLIWILTELQQLIAPKITYINLFAPHAQAKWDQKWDKGIFWLCAALHQIFSLWTLQKLTKKPISQKFELLKKKLQEFTWNQFAFSLLFLGFEFVLKLCHLNIKLYWTVKQSPLFFFYNKMHHSI